MLSSSVLTIFSNQTPPVQRAENGVFCFVTHWMINCSEGGKALSTGGHSVVCFVIHQMTIHLSTQWYLPFTKLSPKIFFHGIFIYCCSSKIFSHSQRPLCSLSLSPNFHFYSQFLNQCFGFFVLKLPLACQIPYDCPVQMNYGKFEKLLHKHSVTYNFPISQIFFLDLQSASGFVRGKWSSKSFTKIN